MLSDYLKTFPQYILPKQTLTTFAGLLANIKTPAIKNRLIRQFIRQYNVDMTEALEETPEHYPCFNEFFIRRLKPECRPISEADVVSPVDGFISELGEVSFGQLLQAKGRRYTVSSLLACEQTDAARFHNGLFATFYLSPKDYHRVHMPIQGTLTNMIYVPGKLFSVQPATSRVIPYLFARNERLVVLFDTEFGAMAMVLVGAVIVGGIGTGWHGDVVRGRKKAVFHYPEASTPPLVLSKASEMGFFKLGSTVVLLFEDKQRIKWLPSIQPGNQIRLGEALVV